MPERSQADRLKDILDEAAILAEAVAGKDISDLQADPVLQRAVLHILQTIGEAAAHLSADTTAAVPGPPWPDIRGMRNRIVHGYFGLDLGAVWRTAREDVPALADSIKKSGLL
jgi:uncharacterized protein with HEPN domain